MCFECQRIQFRLTLEYDYMCSETDFTQGKRPIFQLQKTPFLLTAVGQWSNRRIAEALRTGTMHLRDPSQ